MVLCKWFISSRFPEVGLSAPQTGLTCFWLQPMVWVSFKPVSANLPVSLDGGNKEKSGAYRSLLGEREVSPAPPPSQPGAQHHCNLVAPLSHSCLFPGPGHSIMAGPRVPRRDSGWVAVIPFRVPSESVTGQLGKRYYLIKVELRFGVFWFLVFFLSA